MLKCLDQSELIILLRDTHAYDVESEWFGGTFLVNGLVFGGCFVVVGFLCVCFVLFFITQVVR